ncbi:MAG: hypothetical protein JO093_18700 [Acidobacteria bacterium]|nr:hypothetical protein [Acidobacteriota bacterium]MBV9187653.1 hypothetical protein [Acidobacteriota bacterium]
MLASALVESIRAIFLHRDPYVTKRAAATMLRCTVAEIKVAIAAGDVETSDTCSGERLPLHEVAKLARLRWQVVAIEEALGEDAQAILPPVLWTRPITLRVSRYHLQMLDHCAEREGVPVDTIAARALDDYMVAHHDELADAIEDYSIALDWPEEQDVTPRA